ncbi:MAG TPA: malic enzyme-like NAD(P)-binding protein [Gammaproteobacteria bacterium]|nr:malic enzyme-like NAD(P)-binding protein [Gammaproteobacteria bacterium]
MKIPEILLIESQHKPGSLARILQVIGEAGLVIENLDVVKRDQDKTVWEVTLNLEADVEYNLAEAINALPNARLIGKSDRVFNRHRGGKIRMVSRLPLTSLQELRDVYSPGVARVCLAIRDDPSLAQEYTGLRNTVGIITNGTAILGLGNIGPVAGLPVMEAKAALMARLAGLSGIPILMRETDPDRVIETVERIAPSFGAIQLEDFAAPDCFRIEEELLRRLDRPVMHDDQHGTAVVSLAALLGAARRIGRSLEDSVVGQVGLGAAGMGIANLLASHGLRKLIGTDLREDALQRFEAMGGRRASLDEVMARADIVIATTGVSGLIRPESVREGQLILALTNPDPEILPREALRHGAAFAADGASINNVLGFPGLFRGVLESGVRAFSNEMFLAAARTLAELAPEHELVPSPLDPAVHEAVAEAVREVAAAG